MIFFLDKTALSGYPPRNDLVLHPMLLMETDNQQCLPTVNVHMLAFMDVKEDGNHHIRPVQIPLKAWKPHNLDAVLGATFHYGQNEFQPLPCYSVSVGDVIEYPAGEYHVVRGLGFRKLTPEEFDVYKAMPRRERHYSAFLG